MVWLPLSIPFVGFERAKQLAFEAIRTSALEPEEELHTSRDQREKAEETVITLGPNADMMYHAPHRPTRQPSPKPLTEDPTPPSGKRKQLSSRIITEYPFTGACTQCFFPEHSPEQIAFSCDEPIQTIEHIPISCPLYTAARHKHLTASGRP